MDSKENISNDTLDIKTQLAAYVKHAESSKKTVGKEGYLTRYRGCYSAHPMSLALPDMEAFKAYPDDTVICGITKSGASRLSAVIGMITHDADPRYLYEPPDILAKVPWLDFCTGANTDGPRGLEQVARMKSPRVYWTRLPYDGLPSSIRSSGAKIVYHIRHPKDILITLYHHYLAIKGSNFSGALDDMVKWLVEDEIYCGPWFKHIESFWKHRGDPSVFICSFEALSLDPAKTVCDLAAFLDKPLDNGQAETVAYHTHFEQMRINPLINRETSHSVGAFNLDKAKFMRCGQVGGWKLHLSAENSAKINKWMAHNLLTTSLTGIADRFPDTFKME